jgi:hypothetical protein
MRIKRYLKRNRCATPTQCRRRLSAHRCFWIQLKEQQTITMRDTVVTGQSQSESDQIFYADLPSNHLAALGLRCGQPGQQQGRFLPAFKSPWARSIRLTRVSSFFAEVTQQIHSFCARGVRSTQAFLTADVALIAFSRSAGKLWTGPGKLFVEVFFFFVI